jgi:hypothetical protein
MAQQKHTAMIIDLRIVSCGLKKFLPSFKQTLNCKARTHKSQVVKILTLIFSAWISQVCKKNYIDSKSVWYFISCQMLMSRKKYHVLKPVHTRGFTGMRNGHGLRIGNPNPYPRVPGAQTRYPCPSLTLSCSRMQSTARGGEG